MALGVVGLLFLWPTTETKLNHSIVVDAPIEVVYATLSQIDNVAQWVEAVEKAACVSEKKQGLGAVRECRLTDGSVVREQVTKVVENRLIEMEMIAHDLPVRYFKWQISMNEKGEQILIEQHTQYKVKFGLVGTLMNHLMVKNELDRTLKGAYNGLKTYIEQQNTPTRKHQKKTS